MTEKSTIYLDYASTTPVDPRPSSFRFQRFHLLSY